MATERLKHIDVIRGLCIFSVVYGHIVLFGGGNDYPYTFIHIFMNSFFLIAFFFISGFLSYKENVIWNICLLKNHLIKNVKRLLIPSVSVMAVYCLVKEGNLNSMLSPWNLWVTWFTYVLFLINIVYGLLVFLATKFSKKKIFLAMSIIAFMNTSYILSRYGIEWGVLGKVFKIDAFTYYLPFFFLGILCKMYYVWFKRLVDNDTIFLFILIVAFLVQVLNVKVPLIFSSLSVVYIIWSISDKFVNFTIDKFPFQDYLMEGLTVLGKYSIEIYFVHFILLFTIPSYVWEYINSMNDDCCWWNNSSASFVEFVILCPITCLIAYVSIILSSLLKKSEYLGLILFGRC